MFGPPIRDLVTHRWILPLSHRVFDAKGELLGVIAAGVELQYLERYFAEISADSGASIGLFRNDGTLLARYPESDAEIGRSFSNAIALQLVATSNHAQGG